MTRFEDRFRLPLGVAVNFTAHSGKLLTQMAYNPKMLLVYSKLSEECELMVQDSSAFAGRGERVSFLQLQVRHGGPCVRLRRDRPLCCSHSS